VPDLERFLRGAEPVFESAHAFFPELNPILSLLNFHQVQVAGFISNGGSDLTGAQGKGLDRYQTQIGIINGDSFLRPTRQPKYERGIAYVQPNTINRLVSLGTFESFDCDNAGGEVKNPVDEGPNKQPPCFVVPPSLYDGKKFVLPRRGEVRKARPPRGQEGNLPADPSRR
jgi:hypothetical protein